VGVCSTLKPICDSPALAGRPGVGDETPCACHRAPVTRDANIPRIKFECRNGGGHKRPSSDLPSSF